MRGQLKADRVYRGDCVKLLAGCRRPLAELIFADPPFNIGYHYEGYDDRRQYDEYRQWTAAWMAACQRVLRPHGALYVAIGDDFAAEVRLIGRQLGLHLRNWIIWHYTFGQNTQSKFARAHTHIFYFVADPKQFTFNDDHVRFPSARHTEYSDRRANPLGRLPDDVWDEFPRVCGTFKEREGWHGCQMPEQLLMRIVRASSNPGELVLDPFAGSGTTLVAAAKLGRRYLGIELSPRYVAQARRRLRQAQAAMHIDARYGWPRLHVETLAGLYRETGTALANLAPNEVAMACFTRQLNTRLESDYTPREVIQQLHLLERHGELPRLRNDRPYAPSRRTTRRQEDPPSLFRPAM